MDHASHLITGSPDGYLIVPADLDMAAGGEPGTI